MPKQQLIASKFVSAEFMSRSKDLLSEGLIREITCKQLSRNIYSLPVPLDSIIAFGSEGVSPTHVGQLCNSIDFFVKVGTKIYAPADGLVVKTRDTSMVGGMTTDFWDKGNFVDLLHDNEEHTWHEHLSYKSVLVKEGDKVKKGQEIGLSGNTGFTCSPHLHLQVHVFFGKDESDFVTLKARFNDFVNIYAKSGFQRLLRAE